MNKKYVVTLWQNFYDYDGLTSDFSIRGSFSTLKEAETTVIEISQNKIEKQLKENNEWGVMDAGGKKQSLFSDGVNKNNKVVFSHETKTGDGSGYNSIYNYYEVIEVSQDTVVDANLFNKDGCEWEVKSYFDKNSV